MKQTLKIIALSALATAAVIKASPLLAEPGASPETSASSILPISTCRARRAAGAGPPAGQRCVRGVRDGIRRRSCRQEQSARLPRRRARQGARRRRAGRQPRRSDHGRCRATEVRFRLKAALASLGRPSACPPSAACLRGGHEDRGRLPLRRGAVRGRSRRTADSGARLQLFGVPDDRLPPRHGPASSNSSW